MVADRSEILRAHAPSRMAPTLPFATLTCAGPHAGIGPHAALKATPLIPVVDAQPPPRMRRVGVAMWIGSRGPCPGRFCPLANAAHLVPLFALATMWEPVVASSMASTLPMSFSLRGGRIAAEPVSLVFGRDDAPA